MNYSNFFYLNRGFDKTLWLIPGWAFDFRIFIPLRLPYNYLFYLDSVITQFKFHYLAQVLKHYNIRNLSVLGWSMGGAFLCNNLSTLAKIVSLNEVIICNTAKRFPLELLIEFRRRLTKDKANTLYEFYKLAFYRHKLHKKWFDRELFPNYLEKFSTKELEAGLEYLQNAITIPDETGLTIKIVHGTEDKIVQGHMRLNINSNGNSKIHVLNSGHISFFSDDFFNCIAYD